MAGPRKRPTKKRDPGLSQSAAARVVKIAQQNILAAVARGDLEAVPDSHPIRITTRSAERYARKRAGMTKP